MSVHTDSITSYPDITTEPIKKIYKVEIEDTNLESPIVYLLQEYLFYNSIHKDVLYDGGIYPTVYFCLEWVTEYVSNIIDHANGHKPIKVTIESGLDSGY